MNEVPDQRVVTFRTKQSRFPLRNSTAQVEIVSSFAESRFLNNEPAVRVRCGSCDWRLFDLTVGHRLTLGSGFALDSSLLVVRKCPSCSLLNQGRVTSLDGRRLQMPDALAGPWLCECGKSLGKINDIRGRIHITCRCKVETRVVAAEAMAIFYREVI